MRIVLAKVCYFCVCLSFALSLSLTHARCVSVCSVDICSCSYLDLPQVHFAGQFRIDANTLNNHICSYTTTVETPEYPPNANWGSNGSSDFQFFDSHVTGVVYSNGSFSTRDAVVDADVIDNFDGPSAKLVDIDVDAQDKSTIYGMQFGIAWDADNSNSNLAFQGKWTRSVIAQDMWARMKCYGNSHHGPYSYQDSFPLGSQGTTVITDIQWGEDLSKSVAMQQLKTASERFGGKLSVRVSFYLYTRNYAPYVMHNFTLGYYVGSIGVARPREAMNFGGERLLTYEGLSPPTLVFDETDSCSGESLADYFPWMGRAPFKVIDNGTGRDREVVVDLSNSLPTTYDGTLRDNGILHLGVLRTGCVNLIGNLPIPYLSNGFMNKQGGLYRSALRNDQYEALKHSELVLVRLSPAVSTGNADIPDGFMPLCEDVFPSVKGSDYVEVMLRETPYFLRPYDYYVDRLEFEETSDMPILVTHFGKPSSGIPVKIVPIYNPAPSDAVLPLEDVVETDERGVASFTFKAVKRVPEGREYEEPRDLCPNETKFAVDGQVYKFKYCVVGNCPNDSEDCCSPDVADLVFHAFSTISNSPPYTWVDDVGPIFSQYAKIAEVMRSIVDLSSYLQVTLPRNIHLIRLSLTLDFDDPNYMPVSRDLSPSKKRMILQWLDKPRYSGESQFVPHSEQGVERKCHPPDIGYLRGDFDEFSLPPRCTLRQINFDFKLDQWDLYFSSIFISKSNYKNRPRSLLNFRRGGSQKLHKHLQEQELCNLKNLQHQLQQAIQLEFYTLPVYLTSLYSIMEGCNVMVYNLIRSVVMQEMLHVALAANLLISVDGHPVIDSADFAPSYPTVGLPGGVLPSLEVRLRRASRRHIYEVFMGIEVPNVLAIDRPEPEFTENTIGQFYDEILGCMEELEEEGEDIFRPETISQQVRWPWDETKLIGKLFVVKDLSSAREAIEQIQVQGEGAGPLDPKDITTDTMAHFYKFEQIVCQHRLVQQDNDSYTFEGAKIAFDRRGVWPMRDDPGKHGIERNTNCYTEAKVFHHAYRTMLRLLHKSFNGHPETMTEAVKVMEALHVHARKTMYMWFDQVTTCGPVWDYEWDD